MLFFVFLSLLLQTAGFISITRLQNTLEAYKLRKTALKYIPYVSGKLQKAGGFTYSDSCIILSMPSFFGGIVSAESYDILTIHAASDRLFFSVYPAADSDRKHRTFYINNIKSFLFREVDEYIYFEVNLAGVERTFNFYRPFGFTLVSEGGAL